jgi:hypothetical protein
MYVDFVRSFMPSWLSKATNLKVFSGFVLVLIVVVIALKVVA